MITELVEVVLAAFTLVHVVRKLTIFTCKYLSPTIRPADEELSINVRPFLLTELSLIAVHVPHPVGRAHSRSLKMNKSPEVGDMLTPHLSVEIIQRIARL